jgi:protocatechuate 4,5-dioxygenase alpha chain
LKIPSGSLDRVRINQFFFDVQKAEGLAAYGRDRDAFLTHYAFSPDLRAAIERDDIAAMYHAGANPYLLRFYCVNRGVAEPLYLQAMHAMRGAEVPEAPVGDQRANP